MRNSAFQNWRNLRVTVTRAQDRVRESDMPPARANLVRELPGPDGIRWGLVNRIRAEIAAGVYDTDERLAMAEAKILARWETA